MICFSICLYVIPNIIVHHFRDEILKYFNDAVTSSVPIFIRALCNSPKYGLEHLTHNQQPNQAQGQSSESQITDSITQTTSEVSKKENIDNLIFPTIKSKQNIKCNLCQQNIPDSWAPSQNWSSRYKKMSKILLQQEQEPPKKKYKVLAPPSSESSDQSDNENNKEPKRAGRTAKETKNQEYFLNDFSDQSLHSNSS